MWAPEGFTHGFYVMSDEAEFVYKCTDYYDPSSEVSIKWDDIGIEWSVDNEPTLSTKDAIALAFKNIKSV